MVGFSGGPDSTGLVLALSELADKYNLKLRLAHVNFRQRREESDKDEKFVRELAEDLNLPIDIVQYKEKTEKENFEQAMRNFRYKFFERVRRDHQLDLITTAHTLDDKVETFMMNLLRGSGIKGMISLKNKNGKLMRPLLVFEKKEILSYLKEKNRDFRTDKSNFNTKFLRNRVRLELIPLIERNYNSNFKRCAQRLVENLEGEDEMAEMFASNLYEGIVKRKKGKILILTEKLSELPEGALKRIFRKALIDLKGDLNNVTASHFFEFKKILLSEKAKKQKINLGEFSLEKKKNRVILSLER